MTTKPPSSNDASFHASAPGQARLIVIEGMPGAGKTTIVTALAERGHRVLGEYTAASAATLPVTEHPAVIDDDTHQANWLRKSAQATNMLAGQGGPVFVDRDWLSSLAYAYSIADTDQCALLTQRTAWAAAHLKAGDLLLGDAYVVLHLNVTASLRRRSGHLKGEHPWSHPRALRRLQTFYRRPAHVLGQRCPDLSQLLRAARWTHLPVAGPGDALRVVESIGADR